ncbi:cysteine hydrolase family protein [Priestia koreensis]|uniref:Isochorismatase n=1 Tax=Priestia koreensis TaxID=284581 RepID=A0A0M0LA33_9BACI|nr:cysteine hydrolase family protein [Priestia koreensis]KOO47488.1 isochorismatase [Priestia koreensis]
MTATNPVLVLIDVQQGFEDPAWGERNNPHAEVQMKRVLDTWRKQQLPVIHVQHASTNPQSPLHPKQPGFRFKQGFDPLDDEYLVRKHVNSSFIGTELDSYLKANGVETLVFVGLTTNHCMSTTVRMAGNLGYRSYVLHDATACFDAVSFDGKHVKAENLHYAALTSLHGEFATVVSTEDMIKTIQGFKQGAISS